MILDDHIRACAHLHEIVLLKLPISIYVRVSCKISFEMLKQTLQHYIEHEVLLLFFRSSKMRETTSFGECEEVIQVCMMFLSTIEFRLPLELFLICVFRDVLFFARVWIQFFLSTNMFFAVVDVIFLLYGRSHNINLQTLCKLEAVM